MTNAKKIENLQKGLANIRDYIARCEEANREGGNWDTSFWKKQEIKIVMELHDALCIETGNKEYMCNFGF